jgi:transcription termination/antitermination protein NusG
MSAHGAATVESVVAQSRWYAIWTRSRHESVVCRELARKQIEAFLPTTTRWSRWKDRRKKIEWPLFPGYCFARFNPAASLSVLRCTGVVGIVSFSGTPAPIDDAEVASLERVVTNRTIPYERWPQIAEGAIVDVVSGALGGVSGRLLRQDVNRASVVLSVDLIGQGVRVEVDIHDVRPR